MKTVRQYMEEKGMSEEQLANASGLSIPAVRSVLAGKGRVQSLYAVCDALGITDLRSLPRFSPSDFLRARAKAGYSLEQLAQYAGVHKDYLRNVESGVAIPSAALSDKIFRICGKKEGKQTQ